MIPSTTRARESLATSVSGEVCEGRGGSLNRVAEASVVHPIIPICSDHDDECPEVIDKVKCWLYDPAKGMCPFLRGDKC
jgi:hypothetical protein